MPFFERSHSLVAFAGSILGRLGRGGGQLIDQLAMSGVGRREGGVMAKICFCKERILHTVRSFGDLPCCRVAVQSSNRGLSRDEKEYREGGEGEGRLMPMAWD